MSEKTEILVSAQNLTVAYQDKIVLQDITFDIRRGEFWHPHASAGWRHRAIAGTRRLRDAAAAPDETHVARVERGQEAESSILRTR